MWAAPKFVLTVVAGSVLVVASSTFAADTITASFTGEITASNCSVSASSANVNVILGSIPANTFTSTGTQSTTVPFTLTFSNCPTRNISITAQGAVEPGTQYLALTNRGNAGVASGVAIALKKNNAGSFSALPVSSETSIGQPDSSGNLIVNLAAAYVSTAPTVTAGTANASATFTLTYN